MKRTKYRSIIYFYVSFIFFMLCILFIGIFIFNSIITLKLADGTTIKSDWAKETTQEFAQYIYYNNDGVPSISQNGMQMLRINKSWVQIINQDGKEVTSYLKPSNIQDEYSNFEILKLMEQNQSSNEVSIFYGTVQNNKENYIYLISYPLNIIEVKMFLNGDNFNSGKSIIIMVLIVLFVMIVFLGFLYNYWLTKNMSNMTKAIADIKDQTYFPVQSKGSFEEVYDSLNKLNEKISHSNNIQKETDMMREQWIANITHDLKTPLSPIKGYAELLIDHNNEFSKEKAERYAKVIIKNIDYAQVLIDDMKTVYQLDNEMISIHKHNANIVRFLRNTIIDILNQPDFEKQSIIFDCDSEEINYEFDETLLTRAFYNLIINSFIHGGADTVVNVKITHREKQIIITISDNGKGMTKDEASHLFDRYYRGTNSKHKPEGTGLGLAITKQIIHLHNGDIAVDSVYQKGTTFIITFLHN